MLLLQITNIWLFCKSLSGKKNLNVYHQKTKDKQNNPFQWLKTTTTKKTQNHQTSL